MQAEVDIRACLMAKRGGEEENVNTCMVPVCPAPKAARQQVAVASRGRVSYCSTVHNVTNLFELSDKGMFWKIAEAIGHRDSLLRSGHWTHWSGPRPGRMPRTRPLLKRVINVYADLMPLTPSSFALAAAAAST